MADFHTLISPFGLTAYERRERFERAESDSLAVQTAMSGQK
jgi:hypothetical protein